MTSEILAFIPARGGSKSIPHKNIVPLAGKPLLAYTCEAARATRHRMRVVVNTDDDAIAAVARECGVEVPFMRPATLARDETPMIDALAHGLEWFKDNENYRPEIIVLLQPTSPLRRPEHIDNGIDALVRGGADTVVSVIEVPHQFNPYSIMWMEEDRLVPYVDAPQILRRQDKPRFYARNGPAVLVTKAGLIEAGKLYGHVVHPLVMQMADSIDVDEPDDLALVEFWLTRRDHDWNSKR